MKWVLMGETARLGSVQDWKLTFCCNFVRVDGAAYVGNGWWITELGFQDWVGCGVHSVRNQNERKGKGYFFKISKNEIMMQIKIEM